MNDLIARRTLISALAARRLLLSIFAFLVLSFAGLFKR